MDFYSNDAFRVKVACLSTYLFWTGVTILCFYKLYLASAMPFRVPFAKPHDETWFFVRSLFLLSGDWMGETYSHRTNMKGPMYSIFIATLSQLGISFKLGIHLMYILACLVFLAAIRVTINGKLVVFIAFCIMLFNPITLSNYWIVPVRINLYIPLVLIYFSSLIAIVSVGFSKDKNFPFFWTIVASVVLALAWNTREESIWLLCGLFPIFVISIYYLFSKKRQYSRLIFWLVIAVIPLSVSSLIATKNKDMYGFYGSVDFKAPQFSRAFNAILSLNTSKASRSRALTNEVRDKLLNLGPETKRLVKTDDLTGEPVNWDVVAPRASWGIRRMMRDNGFYQDFANTEQQFKLIADNIENYCKLNHNECRSLVLPGMITRRSQVKNIMPVFINGLSDFAKFNRFSPPERIGKSSLFGGVNSRYTASRLMHIPVVFDEELHKANKIDGIESKRVKNLTKIHKFYGKYFIWLCAFSVVGFAVSLLRKNINHFWIGFTLLSGFSGGYAIYVLLSAFVVDLNRVFAISITPALCFVALYSAIFLVTIPPTIVDALKRKFWHQ